ncbi:LacI family DNA-binding transcriptional regulator [Lachnoclostridium sp. Marseille-P6806]|uniref:LacI family DNA-binding transcriptional regulator n=1 Tax=Lachnoclostridium sp. Marseille-P6806 TaxID=2364793 RepID=UPI00103157B0|nr:LacI family DNA-binding transcriptional regulator [Lachnoclostridium sp. Marseille-P6806]
MTSKELAKLLGLSEAAVSFTLNDRPGVSAKTRSLVKKTALDHGMNLSSMACRRKGDGTIYVIYYSSHLNFDTGFFRSTFNGIEFAGANAGYRITMVSTFCGIPTVVLDNYFPSSKIDFIQINNEDAAFQATNYLINKRAVQPGYLRSSIRTWDFERRAQGFYTALRYNLMSKTKSIVHDLSANTIEAAERDMLEILDSREEIAPSYFADNDMIAIGAFRQKGYHIPEDISIIGFDDIPMAGYMEPPLTTIHIPRHYMG